MHQKVYKFIQNIICRAFWFLKRGDNSSNLADKIYSCFPTKLSPPEGEYMKHFEHDLYLLVKFIEFRICFYLSKMKLQMTSEKLINPKN